MTFDPGIYGPAGALGILVVYLLRDRKPRQPQTMTPPPPPVGEAEALREQLQWLERAYERDVELLRQAFSADPAERAAFDRVRAASLRQMEEAAAARVDGDLLRALRVLGLDQDDLAHPERMKKAYAARVKQAHPDRGGTAEALREVISAWECVIRRNR